MIVEISLTYSQDWEHYSSVRNINGPDTGLPNIIDNDTELVQSSAPSTPATSFSSTGSSSVERELDSEDDLALYGPNKKARSPSTFKPATEDADVPALSLANPEAEKKVIKIILHVNPQKHDAQGKPRRRLITAREHKALKKLEQKTKRKERKKEAATTVTSRKLTAVNAPAATTNTQTISGMKTLTI